MHIRDFLTFAGVCLVWALNLIVSRFLFTTYNIAPIFYAALRFLIVALSLLPLLRPLPRPLLPVIGIGFLMGAAHFGLMFIALDLAPTSSVSIVLQLSIPATALLSVLLLGEAVRPLRIVGIAVALGGVVTVMWEPGAGLGIGLIFAVASATALALGSVLLKRYGPIHPLRMQAWVAVASAPPLLLFAGVAENGQWQASMAVGWPFWLGVLFSAFIVTILAHTLYFGVLQHYPASLIAPLGLMMPLMTIVMGVALLNEQVDLRMGIGCAIALVGLVIVLRSRSISRSVDPPIS